MFPIYAPWATSFPIWLLFNYSKIISASPKLNKVPQSSTSIRNLSFTANMCRQLFSIGHENDSAGNILMWCDVINDSKQT